AGGQVAMQRLGDPGYVKWKGERDVVTDSSLAVQAAILEVIRSACPGLSHGILSEEGPEDEPLPVDAEHLWIVDPICGSLNFARGLPYFGVSAAGRSRGQIRVGVVYDPCHDELFEALAGGVSLLNGEVITVQQISEGLEAWAKAVVGTDWPHAGDRR